MLKSTMKSATNEPNAIVYIWWVYSLPDNSLFAYVEMEEQVE